MCHAFQMMTATANRIINWYFLCLVLAATGITNASTFLNENFTFNLTPKQFTRQNECSYNNSISRIILKSELDQFCFKPGERAFSDDFHNKIADEMLSDGDDTIKMNSVEELFENLEKNEFDMNPKAQKYIRRFQKKYRVIHDLTGFKENQ